MTCFAGLDVGGAHLKAALAADGRIVAARQVSCPLWLGFDRLETALAELLPFLAAASRVAITMTGELSDLFADRTEGVHRLVARLDAAFAPRAVFWKGTQGFGPAGEAHEAPEAIASANFLATAVFVAGKIGSGVLADMGSTTTDIVAFSGSKPCLAGFTDQERLASGELVYTGYTRTAIMAVAEVAPWRGRWQGLCREYFATMADVRRILGEELPEEIDQHGTADKRGKSMAESTARLARMFGCDAADGTAAEWRAAAEWIAERQLRSLHDSCLQVLSRAAVARPAPLVLAGTGLPVLLELARRLALRPLPFGELTGASGDIARRASWCAPAAALALLLTQGETLEACHAGHAFAGPGPRT